MMLAAIALVEAIAGGALLLLHSVASVAKSEHGWTDICRGENHWGWPRLDGVA
jgi:hypothetical protein